MLGFDVNRFLRERTPAWSELEQLLSRAESAGLGTLGFEGVKRFGVLYRAVSSDLVRARTEAVDAAVVDYLNDLVARGYAQVYSGRDTRGRKLWLFFWREFPALVRQERRVMFLSAAILFAGVAFGAVTQAFDASAQGVVLPEQHADLTPAERVEEEETGKRSASGDESAAFSSFLFTHNIQVTFMVFALGLTLGIGTTALLFYNGVPLGALAVQYHQFGKGLFFWAWILPHGIPELTQIILAGGAGLVLGRALWAPGRRSRSAALVAEAKTAARIVVGGMPILVLAGLIEGTISQIHEPKLPYLLKLVFAGIVGAGVYAYLLFGGRDARRPAAQLQAGAVPDQTSSRVRRTAKSSANT